MSRLQEGMPSLRLRAACRRVAWSAAWSAGWIAPLVLAASLAVAAPSAAGAQDQPPDKPKAARADHTKERAKAKQAAADRAPTECDDCDDPDMSDMSDMVHPDDESQQAELDDYEHEIAMLREQVAALRRQRLEPSVAGALRYADSVLRNLGPNAASATASLGLLQWRLETATAMHGVDDSRLDQLKNQLGKLQGQIAQQLSFQLSNGGYRAPPAPRVRVRVRPPGWLGLNLSGAVQEVERGGDLVVSCEDYPRVESVEPGSPAEAGGVVRGDTVLAYNGRDVRNEIVMSKLLQPGARVVVRVRRAGQERDVPVRVGRRPTTTARVWVTDPQGGAFSFRWDTGAGFGAFAMPATRAVPGPPAPPSAPTPFVRIAPTPMPGAAMAFILGGPTTVAGAEVARMNDDLREAFGGKRGVLVINVVAGTPAAQAGLRGGDVILRAGQAPVTTPAALQRALLRAADRELRLDVARKGTTRTVTLKW